MGKENKFEVEYARTSMSTCRVCMAKIAKDSIRIGVRTQDAEGDAQNPHGEEKRRRAISGATRWHHYECFPRMRNASSIMPLGPDLMQGWDKIQTADRKKIAQLWNAMKRADGEAKGGSGKGETATGGKRKGKRKAEQESPQEELSNLTSPRGVLTDQQHKKIRKLESELSNANSAELQSELRLNNQVRRGKRDEMVQRVAEGRVLGALPTCPKCHKRPVSFNRTAGWYSCPGYFDREERTMKRCNFRTKDLQREQWQTKN